MTLYNDKSLPVTLYNQNKFNLANEWCKKQMLQAVEVLWTPQNEKDTLSERELLEDYPLLRPL